VDPEAGVPGITQAELQTIAGNDNDLSELEVHALIEKIDTLGLPTDAIKIVFIAKPITRGNRLGQNLQYPAGRGDIILCYLEKLGGTNADAKKFGATVSHECGHSLRGWDHRETGGIFPPENPPPGDPLLPWWHLMADGNLGNKIDPGYPPRSSKHWYLRDEKIVQSAVGNKFSKKIP
jgi:hypothetical protein